MFTVAALIYIGWTYGWWLALALGAIIMQETRALNKQLKALEDLMRKLAYDPPFKDINEITTSQWHALTQEQKDAHNSYWQDQMPGNVWFACPGCGYPTARGMCCGHQKCTKR